MKLKTLFKNKIPGDDWWTGFKTRHPEIVLRKPEKLSTTRSRMMNRRVVSNYFIKLGEVITENSLTPERIRNCDETGKQFQHSPVVVAARKGARTLSGRMGNSRENVTILVTINASGSRMPPLCIVKGKTVKALESFSTLGARQGTVWAYQQKAWMCDILGTMWFKEVFMKHCGPARLQLLILDSHGSHEVLELLEEAVKENVIIFATAFTADEVVTLLDLSLDTSLDILAEATSVAISSDEPNNVMTTADLEIPEADVPTLLEALGNGNFTLTENNVPGNDWSWNTDLDKIFSLPSATKNKKKAVSALTSYRLLTSTEIIEGSMVDTGKRDHEGNHIRKPDCVLSYNRHMGAVDRCDQMVAYGGFNRRTLKWWKKVFFHMLDLAVLNLYLLYKYRIPQPVQQRIFRRELVAQMVEAAEVPRMGQKGRKVKSAENLQRLTARHFLSHLPSTNKRAHGKRQCIVCGPAEADIFKSSNPGITPPKRTGHKTCFQCQQCCVPLCIEPCFQLYHTKSEYILAFKPQKLGEQDHTEE